MLLMITYAKHGFTIKEKKFHKKSVSTYITSPTITEPSYFKPKPISIPFLLLWHAFSSYGEFCKLTKAPSSWQMPNLVHQDVIKLNLAWWKVQ